MSSSFNVKADSYSRYAVVQRQLADWLAEWLEPAEQVAALTALEFGAGDGLFTRYLAPCFASTTAVDIAPRMIEQGNRVLPHVEWRVDDAWCLENEPVDRLFSASLLQWCEDPAKVLRHWRTLAKPNGRMLHGFYVAPTLIDWQSIANLRSPIIWRSPEQWKSYFCEAGWTILRSEAHPRVLRFDSALDLLRFFHHTGAITRRNTPIGTLRQMMATYDRDFAIAKEDRAVTSTWTFFRIEVANR